MPTGSARECRREARHAARCARFGERRRSGAKCRVHPRAAPGDDAGVAPEAAASVGQQRSRLALPRLVRGGRLRTAPPRPLRERSRPVAADAVPKKRELGPSAHCHNPHRASGTGIDQKNSSTEPVSLSRVVSWNKTPTSISTTASTVRAGASGVEAAPPPLSMATISSLFASQARPVDAGLCIEVVVVGALDGCPGQHRVTEEPAAARSDAGQGPAVIDHPREARLVTGPPGDQRDVIPSRLAAGDRVRASVTDPGHRLRQHGRICHLGVAAGQAREAHVPLHQGVRRARRRRRARGSAATGRGEDERATHRREEQRALGAAADRGAVTQRPPRGAAGARPRLASNPDR
jgi:hypothetical protein